MFALFAEKLIVPTVTPAALSWVVVPATFAAVPKLAIAPVALGTPVPFHPGLPLLLQRAVVPVQSEASTVCIAPISVKATHASTLGNKCFKCRERVGCKPTG